MKRLEKIDKLETEVNKKIVNKHVERNGGNKGETKEA